MHKRRDGIKFLVPIVAGKTIKDFYDNRGYDDMDEELFDSFNAYHNFCNYILDRLVTAELVQDTDDGWVNLHSNILKSIILPNYSNVLNDLEMMGYININHSYVPDAYSKSYKVDDKVNQWYEVQCTDKLLERRLIRRDKKAFEEHPDRNKQLIVDVTSVCESLSIDIDEAMRTYNNYVEVRKGKNEDTVKALMLHSINKIINKDWDVKISKSNGRMTSAITMLKKELRHALRIDGDEVYEVDVKCCQPTILLGWYKHEHPDIPVDVEFENQILHGDLYNYLIDGRFPTKKINKYGRDWCRKKLKAEMLNYLFESNEELEIQKGPNRVNLANVMMLEMPVIDKYISSKKEWPASKSKFAISLQRSESDIMIQQVLPELINNGIHCFTIHDAVICKRSDVEVVRKTILKYFSKAEWNVSGVTPQIKIEKC